MSDKTYWRCDRCGGTGVVAHDEHADIYTVINKLEDDHKQYERMHDCLLDLSMVRVNPKKVPPVSRRSARTSASKEPT